MNGIRRKRRMLALFIPLILTASFKSFSQPSAYIASTATEIITFNDDGGWSWFEDERAIVHKSKVIIGSVAAGVRDQSRKGDIEGMTYDIATGGKVISRLHDRLLTPRGAYDDHNSAALLIRPDGR